jgi:hypothetical protein
MTGKRGIKMITQPPILSWLLEGDPAIRWQTLRDLTGAPQADVLAERDLVSEIGWGARLLDCQDADGRWAGQLYDHKWLSTTYSLLLLRQLGLDPCNPQALKGCRKLLEGGFQPNGGICLAKTVDTIDNGVTGMILALLAYFDLADARVPAIAAYLAGQEAPGGWWEPEAGNRQPQYRFAASLLVLDGLHEFEQRYPDLAGIVGDAQQKGREFLLSHYLFKTVPEGEPVDAKMLLFSFPPRWHYDVLTALDYFQACRAKKDERLRDAIDLLRRKQRRAGTWDLQNRHAGKTFFEMEVVGKPSRWNTLRALRVLKWWDG